MIRQPAKVIAETPSTYLLETLPQSSCPRCEAGQGCGGGILTKAFANKTYRLSINKTSIPDNRTLKIQELVQIGLRSAVLIRASMLMYLLPMVLMVTGASIAGLLINSGDVFTVAGALTGLALGVALSRKLSNHYINSEIASPVLVDEPDNCWYQAD